MPPEVKAVAALTVPETRINPLVPETFEETISVAEVLAKSGFFQDAKEAAQAVAKILAGRELGFPPMASMTGIFITRGRVGIHATLMAAAVQRSGRFSYRVAEHTDHVCDLLFFEGKTEVGRSRFSLEDAKRANLSNGDNWRAYPRNMVFARAMSNGVKWYCPAVFGGPVYTPEELEELPAVQAEAQAASGTPAPGTPISFASSAPSVAQPDSPPTELPLGAGAPVAEAKPNEKLPSYEPFGAIKMVTELQSGHFTQGGLERYFGSGIRTKSALETMKANLPEEFKAAYDRLRADYKAGKGGPA